MNNFCGQQNKHYEAKTVQVYVRHTTKQSKHAPFVQHRISPYSFAVSLLKIAHSAFGLVHYFITTQPQACTDKSNVTLKAMLQLLPVPTTYTCAGFG